MQHFTNTDIKKIDAPHYPGINNEALLGLFDSKDKVF